MACNSYTGEEKKVIVECYKYTRTIYRLPPLVLCVFLGSEWEKHKMYYYKMTYEGGQLWPGEKVISASPYSHTVVAGSIQGLAICKTSVE